MPEGSGKALWEKVYNERVAAGDDKEKAAKKAWGALKNAGWKKNENGEWVKGKSEFAEFSMSIVKASFDKENQMMRWRSVNSDTDPDLYDEAMSPELFQDFVNRIENKTPVPEPFDALICEDEWCGGMPYLSLAHYKSGTGKKNVPGEPDSVYVDGAMLKSTGYLYNNPLGKRVFDALNADLYKKKSDGTPAVPPDKRVRISIGFLDLQHKHQLDDGTEQVFDRTDVGQICHLCSANIGRKIYTKGVLVHLALTRVPVNPRTLMEMEKSMGAIVTKKDDAASIIGEDLVEELENKSLADGILVVKAEGMTLDFPDGMDKCYDPNTASYDQDCVDNLMAGHMPPLRNKMADNKKLKARTSGDDSMTDRVDRIRQAFHVQFPSGPGYSTMGAYVEDIFEGFVIVCSGQDKFRVPYTENDDEVEFGNIDKWSKVREETYYVDEKSDTVSKAQTKSESWGDEPSSSYLIVEDKEHPTSWHLPVKKNGKLDTGLMGAAKAALTSNHRGHAYGGPGKAKALAKLKSLYKSHGMEWDEGKEKSITEDSMTETGSVKGLMPSKKTTKGKNVDTFDDEERVDDEKEAYGQGKAQTMRKGDEPETEKEDEGETEADEKKEAKEKKSLMAKFSRVADKALELRSAGISGKDAEVALQPLLDEVGKEIEKSLSPTGDTALVAALSEITKTLAAQNEMLVKATQEIAVLKAGSQQPRVESPFIPKPRSLRVEKSNPSQPTRKLSQIEELARRSTGLPVE